MEMLALVLDALLVFIISTSLFDVVHFLLHRWQRSRFAILRTFGGWHQVHHDFLDKNMDVHPELKARNFWAHLVPEYLTSIGGTLLLLLIFSAASVAIVCAVHTILFGVRIVTEGIDTHHMAADRLSGQRGLIFVRPAYHALHHVNPMAFYSSFLNVFDMIVGTAWSIRGKRIAVTGASGAFGSEIADRLEKAGATVARIGRGLDGADLTETDVLVLAHGSKGDAEECWLANFRTPIDLGNRLIETAKGRLVPPEIWGVGSEAELYGIGDYAMSKREFANYAATYWRRSREVTYRHIVPSAFRSAMGWGPMSAGFAAAWALFLIRRGFAYVPVTMTTLALWNYFRFIAPHSRGYAIQNMGAAR